MKERQNWRNKAGGNNAPPLGPSASTNWVPPAQAESWQRAFLSSSQELAAAVGAVHLTGRHSLDGWHEPAPTQGRK